MFVLATADGGGVEPVPLLVSQPVLLTPMVWGVVVTPHSPAPTQGGVLLDGCTPASIAFSVRLGWVPLSSTSTFMVSSPPALLTRRRALGIHDASLGAGECVVSAGALLPLDDSLPWMDASLALQFNGSAYAVSSVGVVVVRNASGAAVLVDLGSTNATALAGCDRVFVLRQVRKR